MGEILIIQRIFTKYRKDVLDEFHKQMDFTLLHSKNNNGIKQFSSPYSRQIGSFRYSGNETHYFLNVFPYILKKRPKIIIHEFSIGIASLIPTYLLSRILGIKFILWGHGYDRANGFHPERSLSDKMRLFLLKKADAVIFYGLEAKLKMSKYVKSEKLFIAFNCLNTYALTIIRNKLEKEGRESVKKRLGFKDAYNLIFISRILKSKEPQLLIEIYEHLINKTDKSICIHIVGDGEYLNQLKDIVNSKGIENNIKFYGAIHDDLKSGELLYCSDLMIMPGYVGLSVNHAFNFDCPVVTWKQKENGPFHSPEIEYLINDHTGFIIESHSVESTSETIAGYLNNKDRQHQMRLNVRKMVETTCSINNFMKGFGDAIKFAIKK